MWFLGSCYLGKRNHIAVFFHNIKPLIAEYEKMLLGVGSVNFFLTFYVPLKGL